MAKITKIKRSKTTTERINKQADIVRFAIHDNHTATDSDLEETYDNLRDEIVILCELLQEFLEEWEKEIRDRN